MDHRKVFASSDTFSRKDVLHYQQSIHLGMLIYLCLAHQLHIIELMDFHKHLKDILVNTTW